MLIINKNQPGIKPQIFWLTEFQIPEIMLVYIQGTKLARKDGRITMIANVCSWKILTDYKQLGLKKKS